MATTVSPGGAVIRGNTVTFTSSPTDADGAPVEPDSVTLTLSYVGNNSAERTSTSTDMSHSGDSWIASFNTGLCQSCLVEWSVKAAGPAAADEGSFNVVANRANLAS
jgi:hypothetical protein